LHYAVSNNNIELVKDLLQANTPLKVRDNENNGTPLGWVGGAGADKTIGELLKQHGAEE